MPGLNQVTVLGYLTRDVLLSYTPNQTAVADIGLAVNRKWTGSDGAKHDEVCFFDVRAFGTTAENVNKYMSKGRLILVQGHMAFEQWGGKDGSKHNKLRLIAQFVQFMPDGKSHEPGEDKQDQQPAQGVPNSNIPF